MPLGGPGSLVLPPRAVPHLQLDSAAFAHHAPQTCGGQRRELPVQDEGRTGGSRRSRLLFPLSGRAREHVKHVHRSTLTHGCIICAAPRHLRPTHGMQNMRAYTQPKKVRARRALARSIRRALWQVCWFLCRDSREHDCTHPPCRLPSCSSNPACMLGSFATRTDRMVLHVSSVTHAQALSCAVEKTAR